MSECMHIRIIFVDCQLSHSLCIVLNSSIHCSSPNNPNHLIKNISGKMENLMCSYLRCRPPASSSRRLVQFVWLLGRRTAVQPYTGGPLVGTGWPGLVLQPALTHYWSSGCTDRRWRRRCLTGFNGATIPLSPDQRPGTFVTNFALYLSIKWNLL